MQQPWSSFSMCFQAKIPSPDNVHSFVVYPHLCILVLLLGSM
jgi:hypothetical protein